MARRRVSVNRSPACWPLHQKRSPPDAAHIAEDPARLVVDPILARSSVRYHRAATFSIAIVSTAAAHVAPAQVRHAEALRVFQIDQSHSTLSFSVGFLGLANVRGSFRDYAAAITHDPTDPTNSSATIVLQVASIDTRNEQRDEHLKSADFFDAQRHPVIVFESRRIERVGSGFRMTGILSMHGVTREITIPITGFDGPSTDRGGNQRIAFTGSARLKRQDFGIVGGNQFNPGFDLRDAVIGDDVEITIEVLAFDFNVAAWPYGGDGKHSVGPLIEEAAVAGGGKAAARRYAALRAQAPDSLDYGAFELAKVGHRLLSRGQHDAATQIFDLAAQTFPSAPTHNSAGLAYLRAGDAARALPHIEAALKLNPNSPTALELARRLRPR